MTSLVGTNVVYPAFRNAVVGKTSSYNIGTNGFYTNLATTLYATFSDSGTVTPDEGNVFETTYVTSENPQIANKKALDTVTLGAGGDTNAAAGVVSAATTVFDSSNVVFSGDAARSPVDSYIIYKFITNAAASPLMVHFGSATGLTGGLIPNDAAVSVVYNLSGIFKF